MRKTRSVWRPLIAGNRKSRREGVYDERQLRQLFTYERVRADRTGHGLAAVVCRLNGNSPSRSSVNRILQTLARSIRQTDHLGWLGKNRLCVILPLTSYAGAKQFVESIESNNDADGRKVMKNVSLSVHAYPDEWFEYTGRKDDSGADSSASAGSIGSGSNSTLAVSNDSTLQFVRRVPRWKRGLDIFGSVIGLLLLSPLFGVIALYIKLVSPGPAFFRQKRVGLAGKQFDFYKFRTMHHNNNQGVHSHHAKDFINSDKPMTKLDGEDPRIIKGGRILRKLAIDELPQLWNILKGDMSLVGPRPCIPYEADEYHQWHTDRFSILPGLTGLWQVSGKNKLTFQEMIRLDIEYSRRMSLPFDLWIVLRTIPTVVQLGIEGTRRRLRLRQTKLDTQVVSDEVVAEPALVSLESRSGRR